jgi:beta-propeller repeat-containing protein
MKPKVLFAVCVCVALSGLKAPPSTNAVEASKTLPEAKRQPSRLNYAPLPLSFEVNHGQTDRRVKFLSRGRGYTLFLTPTEAVLALSEPQAEERSVHLRQTLPLTHRKALTSVLRMRLVGANPAPHASGLEELPGKSNYFIGNDPKKWRMNVPNYAKVKYEGIYPGVDLVYYGKQRQLEHDFILAPGANPSGIALELKGADKLSLDSRGDLVLATGGGEVRLQKPVVYQEADGARREIAGSYVLKGKHRVGFELGAYDATRRLVIDPVLSYSTYLGGSGNDVGSGIAVDSSGNAYVAGSTGSTNFPGASSSTIQSSNGGGGDAFVAKLNAAGSTLVYSTYLGGSGFDEGLGIAVDSSGNAYVTGLTQSTNFPTANAFESALSGVEDAFVAKLNATGSALVYSTYLGGSGFDVGYGIAADSSGNAYVTGVTGSTNFPTANAFQSASGGGGDAFVTELNAAGSALVYSTYLGGNSSDTGLGIAVDSSGNAYVTGTTFSANFPVVNPLPAPNNALQGRENAFVSKVSFSGSTLSLAYSTYLGGSGPCCAQDEGHAVAVDSSGSAYVTGITTSTNFPTTPGAFQTAIGGSTDAFVSKLSLSGATLALAYSTFLGGVGEEVGFGIAVDPSGNAYVTGLTTSPNFPTVNPLPAPNNTLQNVQSAFVTELNAAGSALVYSTYLGGSAFDIGIGIAVDSSGSAYVTGWTLGGFPTTTGAYQTTFGGGTCGGFSCLDAFVAKISQPDELLNNLVSTVQSFNLQQGISNSLDVKLENAVDALNAMHAGDITTACNNISAFINDVQAQSGTALTTDQAAQLVALADQIKAALGCP